MPNMETISIPDELKPIVIRLMADSTPRGNYSPCFETLYGSASVNLPSILVQRSLFLENQHIINRIAGDGCRVYSYLCNGPRTDDLIDSNEGLLKESLIKLINSPPMKSFMRLSFQQLMNFITRESTGMNSIDLNYLTSFINELRASYSTLCLEDRTVLKPHSKMSSNKTFLHDARGDICFLINWVIIEGAKYCINHKFAPDMSANTFLDLMRKITMAPVALGDRISRRSLICLLQNLDKLIQDRILESSIGNHTFTSSNSIQHFYQSNSSVFRSWFSKNRQNIAHLSLIIGEPAECWRNVNFRLCSDLATKLNGFRFDVDSSLSQTLRSLNKKNWLSNLNMLAVSAKELGNIPLLYGIKILISRGLICDYPSLDVIIANLSGNYELTYDSLINSEDTSEHSIIEFLNSCIELNKLEENKKFITKLTSPPIRDLYTSYLASKSSDDVSILRATEIEQWLGTWSTLNDSTTCEYINLSKNYIDLIVPTCLNIISRTPRDNRDELFTQVENLLNENFISECIFPPSMINSKIKVYQTLVDTLKTNSKLDHKLIEIHQNDLYWNHLLYRYMCDLKLIDQLRNEDGLVNLVQLRAAKYNLRHKNFRLGKKIVDDLKNTTSCLKTKFRSSFLLLNVNVSKESYFNQLLNLVKEFREANLPLSDKCDLLAEASRLFMKSYPFDSEVETDLFKLISDDENLDSGKTISFQETMNKWQNILNSSSDSAKIKTFIHLSACLNSKSASTKDDELYSSAFNTDLQLLQLVCNSTAGKYKSLALECATRLLTKLSTNSKRLSQSNLDNFLADEFVTSTKSVWLILKNNLISLVLYQNDEYMTNEWRKSLINILKIVGQEYPNLLIYSIIVNRLDLQIELLRLGGDSSSTAHEPCTLILHSSKELEDTNSKLSECQAKLLFWDELLDHLKVKTQSESKWQNIITETESFLKEIRKISFLCGEYFKALTLRIPKKLFNFLDYFSRHWDSEAEIIQGRHRVEECEKRLKAVCSHALNNIRVLLNYTKKVGEAHMTKYDIWFCETFNKHLNKLEQKLSVLLRKRPLIYTELQSSIKEITDLMALCRKTLLEYNHNNRQKLFMELISPMLSRLEPSSIPMPDCCNESANPKKPIITIHKISQTVNLIVSKTSPKRIQFIGSDGITRSFLLKAHEDLRLDQLIMDVFSVINNLFLGHKSTRDKYRLRRYSVTPVSTRSALIQWIEAPSLCSFYRAWLNSPNGKKVVDELYETTCSSLCTEYHHILPRDQHINCLPAQTLHQTTDIFYQLLWSKIKPTKIATAQTRPTFSTIIKYHNQFDSSVFESVVEQLINRMPDELVANQLWYRSNNSHSYWLKTRQFIHSTAAMSIVGYIIGLGDRHPENILIDLSRGEVIHIDYNICFELGKTLSIPEQVPFRLTQNLIQAFGFAGLEGGFTMACCDVLDTLKRHQSALLYLLEPINLSFMIGQPSKIDELKDASRSVMTRSSNISKSKLPLYIQNQQEMDMCSQESVNLDQPVGDVNDLLILNNSFKDVQVSMCDKVEVIKTNKSQVPHSFDVQHNIEMPTKILSKTAINMHKRIANKLCGTDESLSHYGSMHKYNEIQFSEEKSKQLSDKKEERMIDLIMLNETQITRNQVNALILEATSLKNKAAMFEGWVPWI